MAGLYAASQDVLTDTGLCYAKFCGGLCGGQFHGGNGNLVEMVCQALLTVNPRRSCRPGSPGLGGVFLGLCVRSLQVLGVGLGLLGIV